VEVLELVANQIGTAMDNARLYGKLREKAALTEAELKETQNRLLRAERLAALGQLSQGVAHEVRNPVMTIGGFARRLLKALKPGDPSAQYAEIILQETGRLEKMVSDVDQYTKMPEPVLKEWLLSDLVHAAVQLWQEDMAREDVRIEIMLPPDDPTLYADREQMVRAFFHLMRNASDAMPHGGSISISADWDGHRLSLRVRDTGTGIASEDLPRIFDPFFTSKTRGSGLGLTTVNRIVSEHGGEVKVSSQPEQGTEVELLLDPRPWKNS
jgi:signal transduction histidine kinase